MCFYDIYLGKKYGYASCFEAYKFNKRVKLIWQGGDTRAHKQWFRGSEMLLA